MSEKAKIEYNWYEILELVFYPIAEEDEDKIEDRIEEKQKEWISKRNLKEEYKIYSNLYNKGVIQEQMLGENNIRKELIKNAVDNYFKPVDEILRDLGDISVITEELLNKIVETTKIDENLLVKRIQSSGKKIEYTKNDAYKKYFKYINKEFSYSFSEIGIFLKTLNKENLYDFLASEDLDFRNLSKEIIDEKRAKLLKSNEETSTKKKLYSKCEEMLKNPDMKKEYDEYLKYLDYKKVEKILERTQRTFNLTTEKLSTVQSNNFINDINEILNNAKEAQDIFIGFCKQKKILYDILNNNENEILKNFSNDFCNKAFEAINNFKLDEAQKYLNEARVHWEENPRIRIIEIKLEEIMKEISEIRHHINFKNYGIAREKYELFKKKYPNFSDMNIERELYNTTENTKNDYSSSNYNNYNNYSKKKSSIGIFIPFIIIIAILIIGTGIFFIINQIREYQRQNSFPSVSTVDVLPNKPDSQNLQTGSTNANANTNTNSSNVTRKPPVDNRHEIINGYTYLKPNGHSSTYSFKVTEWAELILNPSVSLSDNANVQASYEDYCRIVGEIEKVDNGIVPGTNRVFENATYQEVVDAYKDHLREISQIRQIYDLINGNDNDFESAAGCFYKGTKWNTNNMQFKAKEFKSQAIDELWSRFNEY
ncbi:hypothetical protein [Leptotrichia alba]|uniref:Uncharacterized protein n=1 Tax=Leptotrichia alba TaxID=3239304 RepID=A0AB39V2L6_9FUSO